MRRIMEPISVTYNENDDTVSLEAPDDGMGETLIVMPFCQFEDIYDDILEIRGIKE